MSARVGRPYSSDGAIYAHGDVAPLPLSRFEQERAPARIAPRPAAAPPSFQRAGPSHQLSVPAATGERRSDGAEIDTATEGALRRQVTFGDRLVEGDSGAPVDASTSTEAGSGAAGVADRLRNACGERSPPWLDRAGLTYASFSASMVLFGLIISFAVGRGDMPDVDDDQHAGNSTARRDRREQARKEAQLWVVGPIFICSGILIGIKAITHIYKRMHPGERRPTGDFLTADSMASMHRVPTRPPSYAHALQSPVPSNVFTVAPATADAAGDKTGQHDGEDTDGDSLRRVTIDFEPAPPTYDEALELKEMQRSTRRDAATQHDGPEEETGGWELDHRPSRTGAIGTRHSVDVHWMH